MSRNDCTQLIPFQFETSPIRVITHDDGSWSVVAKDVAEALVYTWNGLPRIEHVPNEWRGVTTVVTPGGEQDMLTLTEQGLYFFMGRSDKPKALPFQKWIYGDVLPTIRRTGSYTAPNAKTAKGDKVSLQQRQAKAIASTWLSVAKMFGTDTAMARVIAADQVKQQTGIDFMPLLAGNTVVEAPMTPTELGKPIDLSPRKLNALLALQGFQEKHPDTGDWVPTEKGRPYCTCNPFKSPHSHHTGYRTLWYRSILNVLDCGPTEVTRAA